MITLITGDNTFENEQATKAIVAKFDGRPERFDGSDLELKQLPDILTGTTLFADKRLVLIKNLSENKTVWADFYKWLALVSDDIHVVLIEAKPDKRTVTYKDLKKVAGVIETTAWTDRDGAKAEKWVSDQAKQMNIAIDAQNIRLLVHRAGPDQWQLFHSLEKLSLADVVTSELIESMVDASPAENVFNLFDAALRGDGRMVVDMLRNLELSEDPYRLFGLLSGQAFQLGAVVAADPTSNVAKDFGIHPYAVSKLASAAKQQGKSGIKKIVHAFAEADDDMKLSRAEPWLLIERALMKVAAL